MGQRKKVLYMAYRNDGTELPVVVGTIEEVSAYTGIAPTTIRSRISKNCKLWNNTPYGFASCKLKKSERYLLEDNENDV